MKKIHIILALVLLVGFTAFGQISFNSPIPYTATSPTGAPSATGSRLRIDLSSQKIYQWSPALLSWLQLPTGIESVAGTIPPAYTPVDNQSVFAINADRELYYFQSGSWHLINAGGVSSVNGQTGVVSLDLALTGNTLSLTGDGTTVNLAPYLDNTDAQGLSWNSGTGLLSISGGTGANLDGRYLTSEVDGSVSNELQTFGHAGTTSYTNTLSAGGGSFTLQASGIAAISHSGGTVTITATEVDGSTSNELQTVSAGGAGPTSYTIDLSNGGGSVTLTEGSNIDLTRSGNTITIASTGGGVTDLSFTGASSPVTLNSSTGTDVTFTAGGIVSLSATSGNVTISATEVDGSTSNELQTFGHAGTTSYTNTLSAGGGSFTLQASGIAAISHSGGTVTITATEVDGSTSNELQTVSAGGAGPTSYTIDLSNGGGSVTLTEGSGIDLTRSTNTITITNTGDLSASNELQTLGAGGTTSPTVTLSDGGGTITFSGAGIATWGRTGSTLTVTATEVDGSTSNELQNLSYTASTGAVGISSGIGTTIPVFVGATGGADGERGLVPKPVAGQNILFLRGDGTWANPTVGGDNWGSQVVQHGTTLTGDGTGGAPLDVATDGITATQIVAGAVGTSEVADNSLTATDLAVNVVSSVDGVTNDGGDIDLVAGGIVTITPNDVANTITISATEVDGSTSNELQTISAAGAGPTSYTIDLSNGGGSVTLTEGSGIDLARSTNTITISNTGDLSTSNELQTFGHAGTTSYTNTLSAGGGSFTLQASGIAAISHTGGTVTITATEVDGSTSNELQTLAAGGTTSPTVTLSDGGGTITFAAAGIATWGRSGNTLTVTATEADGSVSNELQTFGHAGTTSYTNTLSAGGGSFTLQASGIAAISHSGGTVTITATEVDGSTSNELQTFGHAGTTSYTNTLSAGGGSFTLQASGIAAISHSGGTVTITATEVDGSTSNELQNLSYTASTGAVGISSGTGTTIPVFVGATGGADGERGLVPKPVAGQNILFLRGDGTWANPTVGGDNWGSQVVQHGTTLTGDGTGALPLDVATDGITATHIAAGAVGTSEVADNSLTATDLAVNVVSSVDGVTNDGGDIDLVAGGIVTITPNDVANTITISATEVDGSVSNELQTVSAGGTSSPTVTLSNSGGTITFEASGIATWGRSGNTLTVTATEVDGSVSNELQTFGHAGTTSYTNTLSAGGGSFTLQASGIAAISHSGGTVTITATEVDGSTSNELQTISAGGAGPTSYTIDLSNGGGSVTLTEGSNIDLTRTGNTITIASTGGGVTDLTFTGASSPVTLNSSTGTDVTFTAGGIVSLSGTSGDLIISATEVDGSVSNELQTVSAGGTTSPTVTLSNAGGTITFAAAGIATWGRSGNTLTVTATEVDGSVSNELQTFGHAGTTSYTNTLSAGGGSFTLQASGIAAISHSGGTVTITATEVDGSTSNELQTFGHAGTTSYTNTLSAGGGSFTLQASGIAAISHSGGTVTITATEVDGSTSNELQTVSAGGAGPTSYTIDLSNGGGSVTLTEGSGIDLTRSTNTITITNTGDLSASNELQTLAAGGTTSPTVTLSDGGGTMTFAAAGIATWGRSGNTLTVTATEVDGSTSNELQTVSAGGAGPTSYTIDLSNGGGSVTLEEGANIDLTRTGNTITIASTGGGGLSDGDKGDITVSSSGSVWNIDAGVIGTAELGGDITAAGEALLDDATASDQRTTLGLGTIATQASNSVSITGGSITNITDLAVADGGTGASNAATARSNLGAAASGANTDITSLVLNNTGLVIKDSDASHNLTITTGSNLTAARTLTINPGDGARTLTLGGDATLNGGTHSGTNTGDQTITLTGDVTGTGTGSFATTIANNAVTTAKIADANVSMAKIAQAGAATGQVIKWNGSAWAPADNTGGSATDLSFSGASSPVTLNSSTGTDVTFTAGSNITLTGTGTDITIAASGGGGGSPSVISPSQITSDQDNYAPTGWGDATLVRLSGDSEIRAITSFGTTDIADGETKILLNVGSHPIYFPAEHPDGTSTGRINSSEDVFLLPQQGVTIVYDATMQRFLFANTPVVDNTHPYVVQASMYASTTTAADMEYVAFTSLGGATLSTGDAFPPKRMPWITVTTAAVSTGGHIIRFNKSTSPNLFKGGHISFESTIQLVHLSDATDRFAVGSMVTSSATSTTFAPNNTIGIRYSDNINSGKWEGFSVTSTGVVSTVDLGVTVSTDVTYILRTEINAEKTEARFFVNNIYAGRVTTNLPSDTNCSARFILLKSLGTNARQVRVHKMYNRTIYKQ